MSEFWVRELWAWAEAVGAVLLLLIVLVPCVMAYEEWRMRIDAEMERRLRKAAGERK